MIIQVQFRLTPEIVRMGVRRFWKYRFIENIPKPRILLAGAYFCVLIIFAVVVGRGSWLFVSANLMFFLVIWTMDLLLYFALLRQKMLLVKQLANQTAELVVTETNISVNYGKVGWHLPWVHVKGFVENDSVFVLLADEWKFAILPVNQIHPDTILIIREAINGARRESQYQNLTRQP